jgi:hypothetical protein
MSENKQKRVRCSDELFLEAVFSSETYSEISEKTGQKLPTMKRAKSEKKTHSVENMVEIVQRLRSHHIG